MARQKISHAIRYRKQTSAILDDNDDKREEQNDSSVADSSTHGQTPGSVEQQDPAAATRTLENTQNKTVAASAAASSSSHPSTNPPQLDLFADEELDSVGVPRGWTPPSIASSVMRYYTQAHPPSQQQQQQQRYQHQQLLQNFHVSSYFSPANMTVLQNSFSLHGIAPSGGPFQFDQPSNNIPNGSNGSLDCEFEELLMDRMKKDQ